MVKRVGLPPSFPPRKRENSGIRCLDCGAATSVIDGRPRKNNVFRRRRTCVSCGLRFTTFEITADRLAALELGQERMQQVRSALANIDATATAPRVDGDATS